MARNIKNFNWIDEHLRFILAHTLEKDITQITKDFLLTLTELDLSDSHISTLEGLQYATNLTSLNLSKNKIVDASLLSKLHRLTNLEISENRIEDVSFIKSLKKINSIWLDNNNISTIDNLSNLKYLNVINVSNNKIQDLSFIKTLYSKNIKVIATDQFINLKPIVINPGEDYTFESPIHWDDETTVLLDNIQVTGKYKSIKTNKRPSFLYSISNVIIKNIGADCLLKANFFHEVSFSKSGILSGILIQPINIKLSNLYLDIFQNNKIINSSIIQGKLVLQNVSKDNVRNEYCLKNKVITIINSDGEKYTCLTNPNGEYTFLNLKKGRYTILFPFLDNYEYVTPSLYICNLKDGENLEVNSTVIKH